MGVARISWTSVGSPETTDECAVEYSVGGIRIAGCVEGGDEVCRYDVHLDPEGAFRHGTITLEESAEGKRSVRLERGPHGWVVDGERRPDLANAIDLDITATPATNFLPVRRLGLAVGQRADIEVAWVQVPSLEVKLGRQRYTRTGPRAYCYESRDDDFRRPLTVDDDGLVLSYPGLFERITTS